MLNFTTFSHESFFEEKYDTWYHSDYRVGQGKATLNQTL